jgi:D-serine deaminase-like pyridoxal phosphate-dependent protein
MRRAAGQAATSSIEFEPGVSMTKAELPTPALVLDLDAFENNLRKMADHCREANKSFRPHAKTHKCPAIARRQIAAGALGVCVATVAEAESMVAAGIGGVLLTSPIVDPAKIRRVMHLISQGADLMLAVGHSLQVTLLAGAAETARVKVGVLLDVDIGDRRTGVLPGEPAVALAREVSRSTHLLLRGVQAYAGHASHTVGFDARERVAREAMGKAVETRERLIKAGFSADILSGGSTGTYNIDSAMPDVTELQVGSFVFMDVDYRRIGGKGTTVYADFQPSLTVVTTVVSATHADRVSVDAGTKAFDTTTSFRPEPKGWDGLVYSRAGDEFGTLTVEGAGSLPRIGERIEFIVPHCDPTLNLYDRIHATRGDKVEAIWPIAARREYSSTG